MRFDPNNRRPKSDRDFWPTPSGATESLLEMEEFPTQILEPANGQGHLSSVLEKAGYYVIKRDIQTGHDFLKCDETFPSIVTNPPFNLAHQFAQKCKEVAGDKFALLFRLAFLEGQKRYYFFKDTSFPLKRVLVFSKRITMKKGGISNEASGMVPYAWFVWDKSHAGPASVDWIKPK